MGDYNINPLQINEREKYAEFFDLMCTNNFLPKMTLLMRNAKRTSSVIDQTFCKVPRREHDDVSSSIILSGIWDHFPCYVNMNILNNIPKQPTYIRTRIIKPNLIDTFRDELKNIEVSSRLDPNLMTDPNPSMKNLKTFFLVRLTSISRNDVWTLINTVIKSRTGLHLGSWNRLNSVTIFTKKS